MMTTLQVRRMIQLLKNIVKLPKFIGEMHIVIINDL